MVRMGGAAMVAATFLVAVSGSAMLAAAADRAGTLLAQAKDPALERTRQDCIRNHGWWVKDVNVCEYESKAKAAATGESEKQACERNGGAWDTAAGFCEIESKAKAKQ
ncbi:MAG: hypothetical protein DME00_36725 [Candidatus Rokuibacteriota bacterium]|nr:MAG: hypothetical protein DME00_36725 [Candidatus Rokubacteria bacterium]PYO04479.1 MAG: hypothetical protein DMD75_31330 [Candidatus Rokubacteria bacterium]